MTTKNTITETAKIMITENGLINLSRKELCERSGISDGSFIHVMGCSFTEFIKDMRDTTNKIYPVNKHRVHPLLRKDHILNVAIELAQQPGGYNNLTRDAIAEHAGVSMGLINNYFGTMIQLRRAIMRAAIKREIPEIIAQGIAINDKHAIKAPQILKMQAAQLIANS